MLKTLRKKAIKLIKTNDELAYRMKLLNLSLSKVLAKYVDDETHIRRQYKLRTGETLNLENPIYYNEKIQWMKINYHDLILNELVDKYSVRNFVKERIGKEYLIPIYGIYDSIDEVDFDSLPNQFVMKLTNGSSFNYICTNKTAKEVKKIKARFKKWIKIDFYALGREWAYKDVKNRIICEKYLTDDSETELKDYKFFCFNGEPKVIQVDYCRFTNHKRNLYTLNWDYMNESIEYETDPDANLDKPEKLEDMVRCAKELSKGFPHIRVDFYHINGQIYFGELTFYHGAGYLSYKPKKFEKQMGDWLDLSSFNV